LTYLFISHDLSAVKYISDRVGMMYSGVRAGTVPSEELYANPVHPYTRVLLSTVPDADAENGRERIVLEGNVPSPVNSPSGRRFCTRCPFYVTQVCAHDEPSGAGWAPSTGWPLATASAEKKAAVPEPGHWGRVCLRHSTGGERSTSGKVRAPTGGPMPSPPREA
jgi:oligopeptide/dipeptide ABC transporter ATP-binding protein